ncbi:MAG TPA: Holliday junction resolvase RuvX [Deltaproteobacteria bacterium]|nr:Holliday junction resolvase RuvX [Deltaproteobacteria bacterium]
MKPKWIGLDVGTRRIGVAVSDALGFSAHPLCTIERRGTGADVAEVCRRAEGEQAAGIVVGLPVNMNGTAGPQAEMVMAFVDELRAATPLPVETWDERLSTSAVERVLIEGNVSRRKRKEVVDKLAASYILQGFMDSRGVKGEAEGAEP